MSEWRHSRSDVSVLLLPMLVVCKHLFCNALLWLTIFCALVLYDYVCDMAHESVINSMIIIELILLLLNNHNFIPPVNNVNCYKHPCKARITC